MKMKRFKVVTLAVAATVLLAATAAVAVPTRFADVPSDHTFSAAIGWMDENGITKGCNPPDNDRFCPEDYVTRGQMSAFMKRLVESDVMPAGAQGQQGAKGATGAQGAQGKKGSNGAPGLPGAEGDDGDNGANGEPGTPGANGEPGTPGDNGDQGIPGEKGDKGDQGIPGEKGETGETGQTGQTGETGEIGEKGDQGIPGPGSTFTRVAGTPSASNDGQTKSATATCPEGVVVGGGVLFLGAQPHNLTVTADYPSDTTTWSVAGAENVLHNGNWSIQAFAICAS